MTDYTITVSDNADPDAKETLASGIRAWNDARSPHHRAIRGEGGRPLELYARDSHGALLGGLAGETYWGWLFIDKLWIAESEPV